MIVKDLEKHRLKLSAVMLNLVITMKPRVRFKTSLCKILGLQYWRKDSKTDGDRVQQRRQTYEKKDRKLGKRKQ